MKIPKNKKINAIETNFPKYLWTREAEKQAEIKGLEKRKAGSPALYCGEYVQKYSGIVRDWLDKGYLKLNIKTDKGI